MLIDCRPCKTRKVKCDETRPTCVNCQRQSESCDYSIRLNWDGRGKKKGDGSPGQINFSAGMMNSGPSRPSTVDSSAPPTPSQVEFQAMTGFIKQPPPLKMDAI